jgi:hypothetical protein
MMMKKDIEMQKAFVTLHTGKSFAQMLKLIDPNGKYLKSDY